MRIIQALCAAGPVDAVTNQGLACRRLFQSWGWDGADYAEVLAPTMTDGSVRPLRELDPADGELLLVHYSGYAPGLGPLLERFRHSLLVSHNITPARYFWADHPLEGVRCSLGPAQLAELGTRAEALAGVSQFNARELGELTGRDVAVVPVLFDRARLGRYTVPPTGPPTMLFVGRLAPHKRQDLVIRAFARYRSRHAPDARLVLVGVPINPAFEARLRALADEVAPGAVTIEADIPAERLWEHYRSAHAFLCLSEHEGFCIPLLEALHFGVPVIARGAGAVAEVLGDAGLVLGPDDDVDTVAELLEIVVGDQELRAELRARGERRLAHYDHARTAALLRERLLALAT
jgi:glycosyltransferase involved in cell wall biosynthesis